MAAKSKSPFTGPQRHTLRPVSGESPRGATRQSADQPACDQPPLDVLQAALLYLMSRYARTGCGKLLPAIVQHLRLLESHPDAGAPAGPLRRACRQLAMDWTELQYLRELHAAQPGAGPAARRH